MLDKLFIDVLLYSFCSHSFWSLPAVSLASPRLLNLSFTVLATCLFSWVATCSVHRLFCFTFASHHFFSLSGCPLYKTIYGQVMFVPTFARAGTSEYEEKALWRCKRYIGKKKHHFRLVVARGQSRLGFLALSSLHSPPFFPRRPLFVLFLWEKAGYHRSLVSRKQPRRVILRFR